MIGTVDEKVRLNSWYGTFFIFKKGFVMFLYLNRCSIFARVDLCVLQVDVNHLHVYYINLYDALLEDGHGDHLHTFRSQQRTT